MVVMKNKISFAFYVLLFLFPVSDVFAVSFTINNHCPHTIWPATSPTNNDLTVTTGFELASRVSTTFNTPDNWSGRIWARFVCSNSSSGEFSCRSGDCGTGHVECDGRGGVVPATLAEFTLSGYNGNDYYDISLVDGFNLPIAIEPQRSGCHALRCPTDINNHGCPRELSVNNTDGGVIGCKSGCIAFNQPQYCCTGDYGTPDRCGPTQYSRIFKRLCPQAYSYAFDDPSSLFTCGGNPDYHITFCP